MVLDEVGCQRLQCNYSNVYVVLLWNNMHCPFTLKQWKNDFAAKSTTHN